jgi:trehalose-6-phosphate synthase
LRARRPDLRIGFFLHIPFPPIELFMQMPLRAEILRVKGFFIRVVFRDEACGVS